MTNLPVRTLGGKQLWADLFIYAGWRIQENVFTGHSRLLDPRQVRRAWGSYRSCLDAFELQRQERAIRPRGSHQVILLHGLLRSQASLARLSRALREAGYETACVSYPSTRSSIGEHARRLSRILSALSDVDTVSFVTHSLGGLVVRQALAGGGSWQERLRVHRLVMIAPPSRGSALAGALRKLPLFDLIAGPAGLELTSERAVEIPLPTCRFGIIAGGRGNGRGLNPLIPGDDDGVVGVEETRLEGAEDFLLLKAEHTVIMNHPAVIEAVVAYLRTGCFAGR
jgi:hypothetical protein